MNKKIPNSNSGIATLEILIAMVVLVLALTAVIVVFFGGQSVTTDTQTNQEALYIAEKELEIIRAKSEGTAAEFNSIATTATASTDIYTKRLIVNDIDPCSKKIRSNVAWALEQRAQSVDLTSILTNTEAAIEAGNDCGGGPPASPWKNPATLGSQDLSPSGIKGTDIDVANKIVFLTTKHSALGSNDFYIINAASGSNPFIVANLNTGPGLNAVDLAIDIDAAGNDYAFVANHDNTGQLQVIDITDINLPAVVATASLSGVDPSGSFPEARTIFYHDKKVYVGTWETAGPEIHVFDVSTPTSPVWRGSRELNHSVRDFFVRGDYLYVANSGNQNELAIFDVGDPTSIQPPFPGVGNPESWRFDATGDRDGTSVYVLGNNAYLGRKRGPGDEFYILNIQTPSAISVLGSKDIDLDPSSSEIVDIVVVGDLAFLGTGDSNEEFQVWNIANPSDIVRCSTLNFPAKINGLDYENNLIYAAVDSNDALRIIYDNP